jgi:hypothetical protein
VTGLHDLGREYEARRFPPARRLDLHGEGPAVARERALLWIQSHAHEQPGVELLLVLERGRAAHGRRSGVRDSVEAVLDQLSGRLVEWWQPFSPGTVALRIAADPRMHLPGAPRSTSPPGEGRDPRTAGALTLPPSEDIPPELLPVARQTAELRREREGLPPRAAEVLLGGVWIEAQAAAMGERISFEAALARLLEQERARVLEDE